MQHQEVDFYIPRQLYLHEKIKKIQVDKQGLIQSLGKSIVIAGFPYDEGTKRNGGRVGGAIASNIFRNKLIQTTFYLNKDIPIYDSGDINNELLLQEAHIQIFQKNKKILSNNPQLLLFSIGGSNDQSYPNVRALFQSYPQSIIGVVNLDAHFDVRPLKQGKAHSGSPFRQMLENQIFRKNKSIFVQFACKGATCSNQHFKYLQQKGAQVYWLEKNIRMFEITKESNYKTQAGQLFQKIINQIAKKVDYIFISFDIDSINSKYMPGVSAPSVVGGLTSTQAIQISRITGLQNKVRLVDFSEFNPAVQSLISSTMLTQMFYSLVTGFSERISRN